MRKEIITNKNSIYFLNQDVKIKEKIQKIVDYLLNNLVGFRKFKNIPVNINLENTRNKNKWKLVYIQKKYNNFNVIVNKTKLAINIMIFNNNNLIEYKILNRLSNKILKNSHQRYVGSKADYYEVQQLLFEDISNIILDNFK